MPLHNRLVHLSEQKHTILAKYNSGEHVIAADNTILIDGAKQIYLKFPSENPDTSYVQIETGQYLLPMDNGLKLTFGQLMAMPDFWATNEPICDGVELKRHPVVSMDRIFKPNARPGSEDGSWNFGK